MDLWFTSWLMVVGGILGLMFLFMFLYVPLTIVLEDDEKASGVAVAVIIMSLLGSLVVYNIRKEPTPTKPPAEAVGQR